MTTTQYLRLGFVVLGLAIWFLSQWLLRYRPNGTGQLGDGLHAATRRVYAFLAANPKCANALLIASSFLIDLLGLFILVHSIFGPSFQPFVGLLMLFLTRQICQALCALPPPAEMIWRSPGFPTLLVTYGVSNDLFFSGHTAIAVYGAIQLGQWGGAGWAIVGAFIALFEIFTVIALRAHYTMDVFTGAITAVLAAIVAARIGPTCDEWLGRLATMLT